MYPIPSASLVPANNDGDRGAKRKRIAVSEPFLILSGSRTAEADSLPLFVLFVS